MTVHVRCNGPEGVAAFGICQSLLLALTDLKIIREQDARDVLADVVTTHTEAARMSSTPENHHEVVALLQCILAGKDGVRV